MTQKLTQDQADWIRVFHEELPHVSRGALAREYGVHPDTVRNVLNGTSFTGKEHKKAAQPRKLTDAQVLGIRRLAMTGLKEQRIAKYLKEQHGIEISRSTVRQILEGKSYQDVK